MSRSDKLIPKLIKTDVFLSSLEIDNGVNRNLNNLITNKPILETEKPNWKAESILSIGYTQHPGSYSGRKRRDKPLLLVFELTKP